jgi:hypothetical protein
MSIFVGKPPSLIVMISFASMLAGTLMRNSLILEGRIEEDRWLHGSSRFALLPRLSLESSFRRFSVASRASTLGAFCSFRAPFFDSGVSFDLPPGLSASLSFSVLEDAFFDELGSAFFDVPRREGEERGFAISFDGVEPMVELFRFETLNENN